MRRSVKYNVDISMRALFAGVLISLGCCGYAMSGNALFGAVVFSIGLLTIKQANLKLFTGVIGRFIDMRGLAECLVILIWNIVGCALVGLLAYFASDTLFNSIADVGVAKAAHTYWYLFLMAIPCGLIMYFATQKDISQIQTILCVVLFIVVGFEHSVADGLYLLVGADSFWIFIRQILIVVLGNAVGANIVSRGLREQKFKRSDYHGIQNRRLRNGMVGRRQG